MIESLFAPGALAALFSVLMIDLVLAGHTHTPSVTEFQPGRYYVNTGDWINHYTYLVLTPGAPPRLDVWEQD